MVDHNPPTQLLRVLHQILFLLNFRSFFSSTKLQEGGELWKTEMIFTELQKVIFVMIGKSTPWPDLTSLVGTQTFQLQNEYEEKEEEEVQGQDQDHD